MNRPASTPPHATSPAGSTRVLILGSGGDAAQAVDFMGQLGLESAVVDTPSVERLDALRDAAFALILPGEDAQAPGLMLAIGFMLAVLGRSRICLLSDPGATQPAALEGTTQITPDDGGVWHLLLAREMKRAGLDVDLNRAL